MRASKSNSLWQSFRCAFAGVRDVIKNGRNAKIQVVIATAVVIASLWLPLSKLDWAVLSLTIGAVIAGEALNSAIELVVDLVSPDHHELARRAKDAAAGAVLILAIVAVVVGGLILGPPLHEAIWNLTSRRT